MEEVATVSSIQITDSAVMVEWINTIGYCGIGDEGLITYMQFAKLLHCYLSRPDEPGLSMTGELTLGGWIKFTTYTRGVLTGIMGKWLEAGDDRSFVIRKNSNGSIEFAVSETGDGTLTSITDLGVNFVINRWMYIVGRYTPSSEVALFVDGNWYRNTTSIPASIHDSDEQFEIARYNRTNYFDGRLCHIFISAESIDDADVESMYAHSRGMFQNKDIA